MSDAADSSSTLPPALRTAVVLRVRDGSCDILGPDGPRAARFAPQFPTPHSERVSPANLVALATADDGQDVVLWRWFDAVVIGPADDGRIELWEPAHGAVTADRRPSWTPQAPGSRAYVSSGLPGADWWVAAAVPAAPGSGPVAVDLDAVAQLYSAHDLWSAALAPPR